MMELGRATKLPPSQLKNSLLVLLQHNCVESFKEEETNPDPRKVTVTMPFVYAASLDRIIQRLRHARFLVHVRESLGERAESVMQALLEHGRLRSDQVLEYVAFKEGREMEECQRDMEETLAELVGAHYVERAPPPDKRRASTQPQGPRKVKTSGAAMAAAEAAAAAAQANLNRAAQERFRLPPNLQMAATMLGKRRRGEEVADHSHVLGPDMDRDTLWRVNPEEFNRRFRHMLCVDLVNNKVEPAAGAVLNAMLRVSREHEVYALEDRSVPVSDLEVRVASEQLAEEGAPAISKENVVPVLRLLLSDTSELVSKISTMPDGGMTVCVNLRRIMDLVKLKEVEGAVRDRFGASACRIFRLLTLKRQLEQKQIAEMSMLPVKDTRQILYTLLKAGYVTLQEVAKSTDHNPQRTFYVWRVDIPKSVGKLGEETIRAMCNLRARLAHELNSEKEVLDLLEKATEAATRESGPRVTLTSAQRKTLGHVRRVAAILETRMLRLDDLILLFHDA
eukprot:CAMPEP_0196580510 /NCGR_PEP_ID=MMETSP1081-20130531/28923_1 /TAXON_ID=36882 /ORGANISM="Pyramimonas amylifera, Strain CCMP720" /LENGTH=507 /DNA_ID=CAMNT_0041900391 /DNA_START=167 /DNA_END=1690 /DNA_ORIENTATION=-